MALIVAPAEPAESFVSVADATTYHAARGNAAWAALASDTVREQALRKATDYMEQAYREKWAGHLVTATQALAWPRYLVPVKGFSVTGLSQSSGFGAYYPQDTIPTLVKNACAELALRASAGDLAPDVGRLKSRTKVGPIEVQYVEGAPAYTRYRAIDNLLAPLFGGSSGAMNLPVVRA